MLLPYQQYSVPTNIQAVLNNIRNFAVGQGWTQETWVTDQTWRPDSPYGFQSNSGNGDLLQLSSGGAIIALEHLYEHICMGARSQVAYSSIDTRPCLQNKIYTRGHDGGVDYIFQYRYTQNEWDRNWGWALKPGSMDNQWVFGNSSYIASIVSVDGIYYTMMHFGRFPELWDSSPSGVNGVFTGYLALQNSDGSDYYTAWDNHVIGYPGTPTWGGPMTAHALRYSDTGQTLSQYPFCFQYDGREITGHSTATSYGLYYRPSISNFANQSGYPSIIAGSGGAALGGTGLSYGFKAMLRVQNAFSGRKPMFKLIYFYQRQSDSVWCPLGMTPFWIINFDGFIAAQTFYLGGRQYIVFPLKDFNCNVGIVFRIA